MSRSTQLQVPAALAPFIGSIAHHESGFTHARERVLPTGCAQLIINLRDDVLSVDRDGVTQQVTGAGIAGPSTRHAEVDPAHQICTITVAFLPGGTRPFFPAAEATDRLVDVADLCGADLAVLRERVLDQPRVEAKLRVVAETLQVSATHPLTTDTAVRLAVRELARGTPVHRVADLLGTTAKPLIRTFTEQVGIPPKRFARIQRFQRLLEAVPHDRPVDWAVLAAACGYADQAHLIHEFRRFAGITPTRYRARNDGEHNHLPLPA